MPKDFAKDKEQSNDYNTKLSSGSLADSLKSYQQQKYAPPKQDNEAMKKAVKERKENLQSREKPQAGASESGYKMGFPGGYDQKLMYGK